MTAMRRLVPALFVLAACVGSGAREARLALAAQARNAEARGQWIRAAELWFELNDGRDEEASRGLARALLHEGDPAGALRVLAAYPEPGPGLLLDRARLRQDLGRRELAAEDLRRLLALDPESVPARRQLAQLLLAGGQAVEALGLLREAADRAPGDRALQRELAVAARTAGELEQERNAYLLLAKHGRLETPEGLRLGELCLQSQADLPQAEQALRRVVEHDPTQAGAWHLLADLRGILGDDEGRVEALHSALENDPGNTEVLSELGQARARREEWRELEILVRHAQRLGRGDLAEQLEAYRKADEEDAPGGSAHGGER